MSTSRGFSKVADIAVENIVLKISHECEGPTKYRMI